MAPGLDAFDVLLEVVLSLVRVQSYMTEDLIPKQFSVKIITNLSLSSPSVSL